MRQEPTHPAEVSEILSSSLGLPSDSCSCKETSAGFGPGHFGRTFRLAGRSSPKTLDLGAWIKSRLLSLIPTRADHHALDALAQSRRPMDMMIQGWSMRRFHAAQQGSRMSGEEPTP